MIKLENIYYTYPDGHKAINDISLEIFDNESVAIVGENGAGKSTLLMLLVGVFLADKGNIIIDGILLNKKTLNRIRSSVGVVFQNPDDQVFSSCVYEDIAFGPKNFNLSKDEVEKRVDLVLERLEITHLKHRASHKLSGGEKRKVAIASVLSMNPSTILFDEPSSFLDTKARRNLINTLNDLKLIKIIVTHDLDMVLEVCDRVIILKDGHILADGKPKEILLQEELMYKSGLELPLRYQSNTPLNRQ